MELSSIGIKLYYAITQTGTFKALYGLRSVPAVGGDMKRIDVTGLGDKYRRSIKGVRETGDLEFEFFYNSDEENENGEANMVMSSYKTLRDLDTGDAKPWFKLVYPDGTGFAWQGALTVVRNKSDVNSALSFKLKITVLSELIDIKEA